jgi:hypothetical protein
MGHRARIYLQRLGTKIAHDLGEKELDCARSATVVLGSSTTARQRSGTSSRSTQPTGTRAVQCPKCWSCNGSNDSP